MIRGDLSERLIHLTRDLEGISGQERFYKILNSQQILGSSKSILGGYKCICFSEAPISALGQIIAKKDPDIRYSPYGFMFTKEYLYNLGARPVIYQSAEEYYLLKDELKYRHVSFDLSKDKKVDWTWEREWRLKKEMLSISPNDVTLIIPTREIEEKLKDENHKNNSQMAIAEIPISHRFDWHFIVLEDLGYNFKI